MWMYGTVTSYTENRATRTVVPVPVQYVQVIYYVSYTLSVRVGTCGRFAALFDLYHTTYWEANLPLVQRTCTSTTCREC
jgi:hypothetical protein